MEDGGRCIHAYARGAAFTPTLAHRNRAVTCLSPPPPPRSQARFVILRVMLEAAQGFVTLTEADPAGGEGGEGLFVLLDREKIMSVGVPAVGAFLRKLQVFKVRSGARRHPPGWRQATARAGGGGGWGVTRPESRGPRV